MTDIETQLGGYGQQLEEGLVPLQIDDLGATGIGAIALRVSRRPRPGWVIVLAVFSVGLMVGLIPVLFGGTGADQVDVVGTAPVVVVGPSTVGALTWTQVQGSPSSLPTTGIVRMGDGFAALDNGRLFTSGDGVTWTSRPLSVAGPPDQAILDLVPTGDGLLLVGGPVSATQPWLWRSQDGKEWQPVDVVWDPPAPPPLEGIDWGEPAIDQVAVSGDTLAIVASFWGSVPWDEIYPDAPEWCCMVDADPGGGSGILRTYAPSGRVVVARLEIGVSAGEELEITFVDQDTGRLVHTVRGIYPGVEAADLVEPAFTSLFAYSALATAGDGPLVFEPAPWAHPHRWFVDVGPLGAGFLVVAEGGAPTTLIDLAEAPTERWLSPDGHTWVQVPPPPFSQPTPSVGVILDSSGQVIVPLAGPDRLEIWTTDGQSWTRLETDTAPTGDDLILTEAGFGLVAWTLSPAVDYPVTGNEKLDLWTSPNGIEWELHERNPSIQVTPTTRSFGLTVAGDTIFVVTEDGTLTMWVGVFGR